MTSLAVSLSVDSRGPCALYIITDSRITWDGNKENRWDSGQKTFASRRFPDVFGFCGDAFFPPIVIRQVIDQIDSGLICRNEATAEERHRSIYRSIEASMNSLAGNPPVDRFTIYHGSRDSDGMEGVFKLWKIEFWTKTWKLTSLECNISNEKSYLVGVDGSGRSAVNAQDDAWKKSPAGGTSRSVTWAFCDALKSAQDPLSGGAPQLVGLWRIGVAKKFGFWWGGKPYLAGLEVIGGRSATGVDWFNDLFERCSGETGSRLEAAQRHTKPERAR